MHVVFQMTGTHIIDHELDVFDVESSGTNWRCNQNVSYFIFEVLYCELSIGLVHPSVQNETFVTYIEKFFK